MWIRLDGDFPDHPKVIGLTDAAKWLYVWALCYAGRHLTDGYIPDAALTTGQRRTATRLAAAHLWIRHPDDNGWLIHSYLDYQQSRTEVEELRRKRAEAGAKGGRAPKQKP